MMMHIMWNITNIMFVSPECVYLVAVAQTNLEQNFLATKPFCILAMIQLPKFTLSAEYIQSDISVIGQGQCHKKTHNVWSLYCLKHPPWLVKKNSA